MSLARKRKLADVTSHALWQDGKNGWTDALPEQADEQT